MKHKATKQILRILLAVVMLIGLLPVAATPASAAAEKYTIDSVTLTVGRPIVGDLLTDHCQPVIPSYCTLAGINWESKRGSRVQNLGNGSGCYAAENTTYTLSLVLKPTDNLNVFDADGVKVTFNGNSTLVKPVDGMILCSVVLIPKTKADTVEVSVPQPANGATPGTPTAADGHTLTNVVWWKSELDADSPESLLGENEVFSYNYDYYMEATVTAASSSLFGENTAVTVNRKTAEILEQGTNTIRFRYHVDSSEIASVASQIYVADGDGGCWTLTRGETKTNGGYTASYQDGVLTLTNTGDSTISGVYNKSDSTLYCGIFADGDLTLHVNGNFRFDLSGTPDTAARVYGIYTKGDLTLVNKSAADCTVSFTPADGVLATHGSSGIYCESGILTVENKGGGDFTLNARGVGVRPVDDAVKANFTNNGIYADVSITIGDHCTVNATAADVQLSAWGTTTSHGIYAYRGLTIGENAVVTATGGNINPSQNATTLKMGNYQYCYGVRAEGGSLTVNGGTLTATGGDIDYGNLTGTSAGAYAALGQDSYGIYANGTITLGGGAITATAGYSRSSAFVDSSLSKGIFCSNLTVSSGTLTATADDAWLESTGLYIMNNLSQTGGTITGTGGVAVCLQGSGSGSKGIYVINTLIASGGRLTGTGGTMGIQQSSVGLQAGTIQLRGTAQVTGLGGLTTTDPIETLVTEESSFASYPGDSIGVWTFHDLTVDDNAVLTATGGTVRGNNYSSAKAMSIGLNIGTADDCTISGSGKIAATGGETHYGGKGNNYYDSSHGIYGEVSSLTIDDTTVIATGGNVSTKTVSGGGVTKGGESYGLYLPGSSLTLQNDAELTATGGDNPTYSDNYTQKSKVNNSYGAYVGGDITVTDSVLTATGGLSIRTVGLYNGGTVTLNGLDSRLTATADKYYENAPGAGSEQYCYGAMNGDGRNPGGAYTVNGGILLLQGQELAMSYQTNSTLTATTIWCSYNRDGSNPASYRGSAEFSSFSSRKYVKADSSTVNVAIKDWTYGDAASTPTYTTYEGDPTILWTGTTRAGASYFSSDAPTEAGSYTVTVTYPGGQTGSADFAVKPIWITTCSWNFKGGQLTYNGEEQTQSVTIRYGGTELVEGTDYTLSGNKQTNAGEYTLTITGTGNFGGTNTGKFTVYQKTPTEADFNIPEIEEYAYTGEEVELPLPTLKKPMTGIGGIQLGYYRYSGDTLIPATPKDAGSYEVRFQVLAGDNFSNDGYTNGIYYGTLVIQKADNPMTLLRDSITLPKGGSIDIGKFVTNAADLDGSLDFEIVVEDECADASSLRGSTLTVGNVTGEFQVSITADGSANYSAGEVFLTVTVAETVPPSISGTFTAQGTSAVTRVQVENYFYGDTARLLVAQYSGGQMKEVKMLSVAANGTFTPDAPFAHADGCTYKVFLVETTSYVPLCAAAPLSSE